MSILVCPACKAELKNNKRAVRDHHQTTHRHKISVQELDRFLKAAVPPKGYVPISERAAHEDMKKKLAAEKLRADNRAIDGQIAKNHWRGHLIGQTQIQGYKSARSNVRWATARKQKP